MGTYELAVLIFSPGVGTLVRKINYLFSIRKTL